MAPAVVVLGRRWHASSDDFAHPALWGILLHTPLLIVSAVGLATTWHDRAREHPGASGSADCPGVSFRPAAYLGIMVACDACQLVCLTWLGYASLQGSVLDAHLREQVTPAIHTALLVYLAVLGATIYGTVGVTQDPNCIYMSDSASTRTLMLVTTYGHWLTLGLLLLIFMVGYNPYQNHRDVRSWERRCTCLAFLFCCGTRSKRQTKKLCRHMQDAESQPAGTQPYTQHMYKNGAQHVTEDGSGLQEQLSELQDSAELSPMAALAAVFFYMYKHVDFTFTDIITNLTLVSLLQKMERQEKQARRMMQQRSLLQAVAAGAPVCPKSSGLPGQAQDLQSQTAQGEVMDQAPEPQPPVTLEDLQDARTYYKFALASLGWPMYVFLSTRFKNIRCCAICPGCCGCCTDVTVDPALESVSNESISRSLHMKAVRELAGIDPQSSVLYMCLDNEVAGLLPYQLIVHAERKQLVLAIRSSMSLNDVATDLVCEATQLPSWWLTGRSQLTETIHRLQLLSAGVPPAAQSVQRSCEKMPLSAPLYVAGTHAAGAPGSISSTDAFDGMNAAAQRVALDSAQHGTPDVQDAKEGGPLPAMPLPEHCMVHRGILACAQAILDDLNEGGVLAAVLCGCTEGLAKLTPVQQALLAELGTGPAAPAATAGLAPSLMVNASDMPPFSSQGGVRAGGSTSMQLASHVRHGSGTSTTSSPSAITLDKVAVSTSSTAASLGPSPATQPAMLPRPASAPSLSKRSKLLGSPVSGARPGSQDTKQQLQRQEWEVVLVGHSLGAAVATLLTLHLRAALSRHNVRCWAFSPPGGLVSSQLSQLMVPCCTSVVVGYDMIPRLSMSCVDRLNRDMLTAAALCKVPKHLFWLQTLVIGKKWTRQELFRTKEEVPQETWSLIQTYVDGLNLAQAVPKYQAAFDFCMPGRVLYYELVEESESDLVTSTGAARAVASRARSASRDSLLSPEQQDFAGMMGGYVPLAGGETVRTPFPVHAPGSQSQGSDRVVLQMSTDSLTALPGEPVSDASFPPAFAGSTLSGLQQPQTAPQSGAASSTRKVIWGPQGAAGNGKVYVPRWATPDEINQAGLIVSKRMFAFHMPDYQACVLEECLP